MIQSISKTYHATPGNKCPGGKFPAVSIVGKPTRFNVSDEVHNLLSRVGGTSVGFPEGEEGRAFLRFHPSDFTAVYCFYETDGRLIPRSRKEFSCDNETTL
ncbi:hypothetical protein CYMTET_39774 [Cymbomonas tetramitiformis]|uniref:Uncharacterized protein n=1 Tax=Cymbomonas tetramitiformis TaxID=36881 RepID=A0AAE0F461_9CHLO|nr:hypothetical protein CYMTET_39774 [Cymbomonas tetramitiformis]